MSKWILLDGNELNSGKTKKEDGVSVTVFLSPWDVPKAVRGRMCPDGNTFVIDFRYLSDADGPSEPLRTSDVGDGFRFFDGRHSHRLYKIEIDVAELQADAVKLQVAVVEAIEEFDKHDRPKNRGYYDVNRKAIEEKREELFKHLVVA